MQSSATILPYLSWSRIRTMQTCGLQFYFKYIVSEAPEFIPASLATGSAFHAAVEEALTCRMAGQPRTIDDLLDVFRWSLREIESGAPIRWNLKEGQVEVIDQVRRMLEAWLGWNPHPEANILAVEHEFTIELESWLPKLVGKVDLIEEHERHLVLVDVKTSRGRWNEEMIEEGRDQLILYREGLRDIIESVGKPVRLAWDVVTKAKAPVVERIYLNEAAASTERPIKVATIGCEMIERGLFIPSPSAMNCGGCPFRRPCREG